jgi:hypothetical protein
MSPNTPSGDRPEGLEAFAPGDLTGSSELVRALARMRELETLERGALAAAVHPAGAGFERAWLFVWDSRSGLLEGREFVAAPSAPPPLAVWLEQHGSPRLELERLAHRLALRPHRLEGVVGVAWNSGAPQSAAGPESGVPWAEAAHVGAVALRRSGLPGRIGRKGWTRSSAWICDFSSTHSTTARSGGAR